MPKPFKTIVSWSSGKDSALALYHLMHNEAYQIVGLLTTITEDYARISMHGVHQKLLEQQARALNLPLYKVYIPADGTDTIYQSKMRDMITKLETLQITHMAFGDLFLQDIRQYREKQLSNTNIRPIFPLWKQHSRKLANKCIASGFKAIITCIDPRKIPESLIGSQYDSRFLEHLPIHADPCGENGEFHTFVYDAPFFQTPISIKKGNVVKRDGFMYMDIDT